jgi:hypothetical protein
MTATKTGPTTATGTTPARAAEEAYIAAFFGQFLRAQPSPLMHGPSPHYPEIQFDR